MQCNAIQCKTRQINTIQGNTNQFITRQYNKMQTSAILIKTIQGNSRQYNARPCSLPLCNALNYLELYSTILQCTIFWCSHQSILSWSVSWWICQHGQYFGAPLIICPGDSRKCIDSRELPWQWLGWWSWCVQLSNFSFDAIQISNGLVRILCPPPSMFSYKYGMTMNGIHCC